MNICSSKIKHLNFKNCQLNLYFRQRFIFEQCSKIAKIRVDSFGKFLKTYLNRLRRFLLFFKQHKIGESYGKICSSWNGSDWLDAH